MTNCANQTEIGMMTAGAAPYAPRAWSGGESRRVRPAWPTLIVSHLELIHLQEGLWVFSFECMPVVQVEDVACAWEPPFKFREDVRLHIKPQKRKLLVYEKGFYSGNCKPVLHDVEQHVSTSTHAVEIAASDNARPITQPVFAKNLLSALSDIVRCRAITPVADEFADCHDGAARNLAPAPSSLSRKKRHGKAPCLIYAFSFFVYVPLPSSTLRKVRHDKEPRQGTT